MKGWFFKITWSKEAGNWNHEAKLEVNGSLYMANCV